MKTESQLQQAAMAMAVEVKVLGSGCSKCRSTIGMIERAALASGVVVTIVKVEKPEDILEYGVHATPAVVIGGRVVHAGGLPSHDEVQAWFKPKPIGFLSHPTRHLFFTGKGGVGKTSLSTAAALTLADTGKKVLLVSTDSASNLDEMLGQRRRRHALGASNHQRAKGPQALQLRQRGQCWKSFDFDHGSIIPLLLNCLEGANRH